MKKPSQKDILLFCDEIYPEDGVDTRKSSKKKIKNYQRKNYQLCAQVNKAINLALADMGDEIICNLYVTSVKPYPNSSQLLVSIAQHEKNKITPSEILAQLNKVYGKLRYEIATVICRKKTPTLVFQIDITKI